MSTAWAYWWRTPPAATRSRGKRHDARVGHASFVDLALPALEGRVARHGPAPRVVVVAERPTDLVDAAVHLRHPGRVEVREADVVDRPLPAPFRARPVVRHHHDDGVVGVTQVVDEGEQPADLGVGVGQVAGEALHEPLGQLPLPVAQGVPGRDPRGARRQLGAGRDDAQLELAGVGLLPPPVPSAGEVAAVALDPLGGGVVRGVTRPGAEVQEEGLVGVDGAQVTQELDGVIGEIRAQVVALLERSGAAGWRGCRGTGPA